MHEPYFQDIALSSDERLHLHCFHRETVDTWTVNYHFHDKCELVIYEAIAGRFFSNGADHSIRRQQVLFIPPESIHGFEVAAGELIYHVAHFSPEVASGLIEATTLPTHALIADLSENDFALMLPLLKWIESSDASQIADAALVAGHKLLLNIASTALSRANPSLTRGSPNPFEPVVRYLNHGNRYNLSVNDAANLCHMSRSHFLATFKRTYGITFNHFLEERKINAAKYLLTNSAQSINQIADQLEINSAAYFSKLFKNSVGCSPREYRQLKQ